MNPKNWYRDCGDAIRAEFGSDAELFIDLLAATSPRKQVSANWRLAMRIYHVWRNNNLVGREHWDADYYDNLMRGVMKSQRPNVLRALKHEPLSGNKVRAFAANLKSNLDEVTIDVWMCRYFNHKGTLTDKKYKHYADSIRHSAKAAGYKPAEWQAIVWCETVKRAGKRPQSYLTVKEKNQMFFEFYWE